MFGSAVWLVLPIAYPLDRFKEGLIGLFALVFLVSLIVVTRRVLVMVLAVLEIPVLFVALRFVLAGAHRGAVIPPKTGATPALKL